MRSLASTAAYVGPGEDDGELLAAVAAAMSSSGAQLCERVGEDPKRPVAGLVAVGVVQRLEVVEVGHDEREAVPLRSGAPAPVLEACGGSEAGEPVGGGLELEDAPGDLALGHGDVLGDVEVALDRAGLGAVRAGGHDRQRLVEDAREHVARPHAAARQAQDLVELPSPTGAP